MATTKYCVKAYEFFTEKERLGEPFTLDELEARTGWKRSTIEIYVTKKWSQFLTKGADGRYSVKGVMELPLEAFIRLHSQKAELFVDPLRPVLPRRVEDLVNKSREAALLAVQVYNNPLSLFRTHGYIVLMTIAWTAMFHAYFEKEGCDYYYKDQTGAYLLTADGERRAWDIRKCLAEFYGNNNCAERANIEFLIGLRDKIEHRYLPAIDWEVAGECQAALINYEKFLIENFGEYYALNQTLAFSLQFSTTSLKEKVKAKRRLQSKEYEEVRAFIKRYREALPDDIITKPEFSFRMFLIPILGNSAKSADYCVQFVKYDPNNPSEMEQYERDVVLIKNRLVPAANVGKYRPKQVAEQVQARLGKTFRVSPEHVNAWKMYNVRPREKKAEGCRAEFCQFDVAHNDFVYTQEWIDFLVERLRDDAEYDRLIRYKDHETVTSNLNHISPSGSCPKGCGNRK